MAQRPPDFQPQAGPGRRNPSARGAWLCLLALALCGCSSWREVRRFDSWTLYETPGDPLQVELWQQAFEPAVLAIEALFGPFARPVAVHAWSGAVGIDGKQHKVLVGSSDAGTRDVPGVGPARVQAWHARGKGFGSRSGIFIAAPETGTAVHELVHAHYAEREEVLPLWFEEGVATLIGDGAMWEGEWVVDGMAYWPLRELRKNRPDDAALETLLAVRAGKSDSVAQNVAVHFLGWAVVFDLYRETGSLDWRVWYERFDFERPLQDARRRMDRTLDANTELQWLERLKSSDPARRLATSRGVWKVRSDEVANLLLDALEDESHPDVRVALALNLLAGTGNTNAQGGTRRRIRRLVSPVFESVELENPVERRAMRSLYRAYLGSLEEDISESLAALGRFWSE